MSNPVQKLDPRVRRTRKLLKQAFMEIMSEKGFDAMTVQDITDRADINRATFYAHYTDKYELHDQMLLEWFRETLARYDMTTDTSFCRDHMRHLIFAVCDFFERLNGECHPVDVQYQPAIEDMIQAEVHAIVMGWLHSVDGIDKAEITAAAISWSIFGAGIQWSRTHNHSKNEVADTVIRLIDGGLRTDCNNLPDLLTAS